MAVFTLIPEAVQGEVTFGPISIPAVVNAASVQIDMLSSVFAADNTLSFRVTVEESVDGGQTWRPASGFPSGDVGGSGGQPFKDGRLTTGLLQVVYAYDGIAKHLRATGFPLVGGTPGPAVDGVLPGSVPGVFDWGLVATVL